MHFKGEIEKITKVYWQGQLIWCRKHEIRDPSGKRPGLFGKVAVLRAWIYLVIQVARAMQVGVSGGDGRQVDEKAEKG